ncbi:MAG: hypothetical protein ABIH29_04085 [Candidatus Micrarchaeota archaeon]
MADPVPAEPELFNVEEVRARAGQAASAFRDFMETGERAAMERFLQIFNNRGDAATMTAFNVEFEQQFRTMVRSVEENEGYISAWEDAHHGHMNYVNLARDIRALYERGSQMGERLQRALTTGSAEDATAVSQALGEDLFPDVRGAGLLRDNIFFARAFGGSILLLRDRDNDDSDAVQFRRIEDAYRFSTLRIARAIHECYRRLGAEGMDEREMRQLRLQHGAEFVDAFLDLRSEVDLEGRTIQQIMAYLRERSRDPTVTSLRESMVYNISDIVRDVPAIFQALQGEDFPTVEEINALNGRYGTDIVDAVRVVGSIPRPAEGRRAEERRDATIEDARRRVRSGIGSVDQIEEFLRETTMENPDGEQVPLSSIPIIAELMEEYSEYRERLQGMSDYNDRQILDSRDEILRVREDIGSVSNLISDMRSAIADARNFMVLYLGQRRFTHTLSPMWFSRAETLIERIERRRGRFGGIYTAIFDSRIGGPERFQAMTELLNFIGPRAATLMEGYLDLTAHIGSEEIPPEGEELVGTETMDRLRLFEETFEQIRERLNQQIPEIRDDLLERLSLQFYSQWHIDFVGDEVDEERPYHVAVEAHRRLLGDRLFMQSRLEFLTMFTERPLEIERPIGEPTTVDGGDVADIFSGLSLPAQYELIRIARQVSGGDLERITDEHLLSLAVIIRGLENHSPAYTPYLLRQAGRELVEQLEPQQVETVINFIMTFESAFVRAGDYGGLESWYATLPERLRELMRITSRSLIMETRVEGEESMDVRIQMPSENEEYATVMNPSGQVLFQIPIHVYTAWRQDGTIEIPPTVREMLPPDIRDSPARAPSVIATEQRYFEGRIIEAVVHRPNPYIRIPVTLENLRALAPDRLPEIGPMFEWENTIGGDYSYTDDSWLGGVAISDRWEGFGPTVWTELSARGSEALQQYRLQSEGQDIGNERVLFNWDADVDVDVVRQELDDGSEDTDVTDAEEIALSMIAPRGTTASIYFQREDDGSMRAQLYTMAGGVLIRGDYLELTPDEAETLYAHVFSEDEADIVRREYSEITYTGGRGQVGLDNCVLFFGSEDSAVSALQGMGAWGEIGQETRGVLGAQVEGTRGGRGMVQAGALRPEDRWFAIGRVYMSGLGIEEMMPDEAGLATGDEVIGDHIQVEGWVLRARRYSVRAFGDFLLEQTEEGHDLIGGGWGALARVVQDSYGWGVGHAGSVVPTNPEALERLAFSGYWVRREVTDAIVASLLFEDGTNTVRFSAGGIYNIVPSTVVAEIIGGYERTLETDEEEDAEDIDVERSGIGVLRMALGSTGGVDMEEGQRAAGAMRIRWTPQGEVVLDSLEGLGIVYQRDQEIIPIVGMRFETDDDRFVSGDLEAYWLGLRGGAANGHLTIGNVDLAFGGGTTFSGGYGMHGGLRLRLGDGRVTVFAVGSGEYDAQLGDAQEVEEIDEVTDIDAEPEPEPEVVEETDEEVPRATVITGMLGTRVRLSGDSSDETVTTLVAGASVLAELFAGEQEAWQLDLQLGLSRRDPRRTLETTIGYTHHEGIEGDWRDEAAIDLRYRSESAWGALIRPYVDFSYGHDLTRPQGFGTLQLRLGGEF